MKKPKSKRRLARKIATALFTDPFSGKADWLRLEFDNVETEGGGLCFKAAVDLIEKHL